MCGYLTVKNFQEMFSGVDRQTDIRTYGQTDIGLVYATA